LAKQGRFIRPEGGKKSGAYPEKKSAINNKLVRPLVMDAATTKPRYVTTSEGGGATSIERKTREKCTNVRHRMERRFLRSHHKTMGEPAAALGDDSPPTLRNSKNNDVIEVKGQQSREVLPKGEA
jgi:hypothetical protein